MVLGDVEANAAKPTPDAARLLEAWDLNCRLLILKVSWSVTDGVGWKEVVRGVIIVILNLRLRPHRQNRPDQTRQRQILVQEVLCEGIGK